MSEGEASRRSVLITGAASGIGAALARRFARAGAGVALLDRDAAGVGALASELGAEAAQSLPIACDVTSLPECEAAVQSVLDAWGGLDVLVNNAGITHVGLVGETQVAVLRSVLEVNFFGAVHCTLAALPALRARRGRVVVLSSVAGFAPLATRAGYAASKHALHGFFDSLRAEQGRDGVGVTLVCPAFVRTAIGERALGPTGGPARARTGVRGEIEPERVADAVLRAVERGRDRVFVPAQARLAWWLSRLSPRTYERIMVRRMREDRDAARLPKAG